MKFIVTSGPASRPLARSREMLERQSCEVHWRREASQFAGRSNDQCPATVPRHWLLSSDRLWFGNPQNPAQASAYVEYARYHRAREFTCWAGVQRRDADAGMFFAANQNIHDQGGWIWLDTDETPPQRVGLKLRNVVWPYGRGRHSLVLYAHKDNAERAESYTWTSASAKRIALNLRWVQASCTLNEAD